MNRSAPVGLGRLVCNLRLHGNTEGEMIEDHCCSQFPASLPRHSIELPMLVTVSIGFSARRIDTDVFSATTSLGTTAHPLRPETSRHIRQSLFRAVDQPASPNLPLEISRDNSKMSILNVLSTSSFSCRRRSQERLPSLKTRVGPRQSVHTDRGRIIHRMKRSAQGRSGVRSVC